MKSNKIRFALPFKTAAQARQSQLSKVRFAQDEKWQMPVRSSTIINYHPHSIINDPGTTCDVLAIRRAGKAVYHRNAQGCIVRAN